MKHEYHCNGQGCPKILIFKNNKSGAEEPLEFRKQRAEQGWFSSKGLYCPDCYQKQKEFNLDS